jgi:hypothetical protein
LIAGGRFTRVFKNLSLSHLQELDEMKQGVLSSVVLSGVSIAIVKGSFFEVYLLPTTPYLCIVGNNLSF